MSTTRNGPGGGAPWSTVVSGGNHHPSSPTPDTNQKSHRSFQQILQDEQTNRNILEVKLRKISKQVDGVLVKPQNLTLEQVGELIFDIIKIDPADCSGIALTTHRYDTKEIKLKTQVDASKYITSRPLEFQDHEIIVRKQTSASTRVVFKNVPFSIPNEEIINLCECYGTPVDGIVHYERPSALSRGIPGSTRFVYMKEFDKEKKIMNYYWLEGPLDTDRSARITVLHPGQEQQCFNCLRLAEQCVGGGNGRLCEQRDGVRGQISDYMKYLKNAHGYMSLKAKYHQLEFPGLNKQGFGHITDDEGDEEDDISDIWKERFEVAARELSETKIELIRLKDDMEKKENGCQEEIEIRAEEENLKQKLTTAKKQIDAMNNEKEEMTRKYAGLQKLTSELRAKLENQAINSAPTQIEKIEAIEQLEPIASPEFEKIDVTVQNKSTAETFDNTPGTAGESDPLNVDAESPDQTPEKTSEETENTSDTDQMSIKINNKTTIHVKKDNFLYHSDTDTVSVKNEESFMQEINIVCDAKTGREAKLKDMRRKALPIIKEAIKSEQRKRSNSQIRKRSEEESEENNPSKTVRKDSATPEKKKKKDKSFIQYNENWYMEQSTRQ